MSLGSQRASTARPAVLPFSWAAECLSYPKTGIHTSYAASHGYVHSLAADLVDEVKDWAGLRVVDVGCGTGTLTDELRRRGADVVGIDSSSSMIDAARESFPGLDLRIADARNLPFEGELDVIFSNAALHWVPEAEQAMASFARALKPGGRLLL